MPYGYSGLFSGRSQLLFFLIVLLLICGCNNVTDGSGVLGNLFANNNLLFILVFLFFFGCGGCGGFGGFGY